MNATKESLIAEIEKRVSDKILEQTNAVLLIKLINNADSLDEAINIAALGTTYKRTGLHFDKRLEKMSDTIKYFKKNEALSFHTDDSKPTHKLIIGDNYEALQNLLIQYRGKIDVIYIDPPYGKDSMGEFAKTNYQNAITRDNLLSMLYPRLVLAKQLLSEDGVIFCSIDDKNQAYVKCLFDEVMGEKCFLGQFKWNKVAKSPSLTDSIRMKYEYVLAYKKKDKVYLFGKQSYNNMGPLWHNPNKQQKLIFKEKSVIIPNSFKKGMYSDKYKVELLDDIEIENGVNKNAFSIKACSAWGQNKIDEYINQGNQFVVKKSLSTFYTVKNDLSNSFIAPSDLISKEECGVQTNTEASDEFIQIGLSFDYPKPTSLISYLVNMVTYIKNDAIILDFFAGSGTTGHAVLELNRTEAKDGNLIDEEIPEGNRTFILCQLNENLDEALKSATGSAKTTIENQIALCDKINRPRELSEITAERVRRVMLGSSLDGSKDFEWIKKNKPYGGNLDVYEIDSVSNFEWTKGKTPFDVINETLYGKEKFANIKEKIEWVCGNFDKTQKYLEQQKTEE